MSPSLLWAEGIPERWAQRRAKFLFRRQQRAVRSEDGVVTAFRDGQVTLRTRRREGGFTFADKEIGYHGVRVGDLVIHAMDGFAGAIGVSDSDGKCSPVCSVCTPLSDAVEVRYYAAVLRHLALSGFISSLAKGIRERSTDFRFAEFKELVLPLPPKEEQQAIVSFLDRKTKAIDALITKKEQFIDLLQERRQALITQLVTKGLDTNVSMKDSGSEWLGVIPAHWKVFRVKHAMARIVDCPHETPEVSPDFEYPAIRTSDVDRGRLLLEQAQRVSEETYRDRTRRLVPTTGDVLYSREGGRFGHAALVPSGTPLCLGQRMMLFRTHQWQSSAYFMWVLNADCTFRQVTQDTLGAAAPRVNIPTISNAVVPCPPLEEQEAIAKHIDDALRNLDGLESAIAMSLSQLREYRQTVIASAVTGRLTVSEDAHERCSR